MKINNKIIAILIAMISILVLTIPLQASASDQSKYPTLIGGLPVIYVHTSENSAGLKNDEVILTIFDKNLTLDEQSIAKTRTFIYEDLAKNPLPKNCRISLYGGPGASVELYEKTNNEIYNYEKTKGSILPGNSPALPMTNYDTTFAIDKNRDPYYSTSVTFQYAYWYSPTVGHSQNHSSELLVNGMTNTNYVMQAGQAYLNDGTGMNTWTDQSQNPPLINRWFLGVSYHAGNNCKFAIGYLGAGNGWFMSCTDYTAGLYQEIDEPLATGDNLKYDNATSVWFENKNTNSNWYSGFSQQGSPNSLTVRNAYDVVFGTFKTWTYDYRLTIDGHGGYHEEQNQNVITGDRKSVV